ncbi:MAG TPA: enolase C-terminal domain-like protein [Tepidisphaeraceae bacterium]|nr:enolase C-terminal domain-like protein [Tepidisphaeraceae bacterium]
MRIKEVHTYPITLPVRPEFVIVSSAGRHAVSRYVLVELRTDEGISGWGEATVMPIWSGETQGSALAAIDEILGPFVVGRDHSEFEEIAAQMDAILVDNFFTKAAVEMALLDLAGKAAGKPVYELLNGGAAVNALRIPIKFSIGLREPENAAGIAAEKVREGFTALKMKVGPDAEKDLLRVRLVREAVGPDVRLNIDVNGGWSVDESIRQIPRYLPFDLDYVEQPVPRWDIDGMATVRAASPLPIMADESVFAVWQAEQVLHKRAADLISIYPGKNGGILRSLTISRLAAAEGVACHVGSNLEWDIATAAMCQLVAAPPNVQVKRYPVDILGPLYYAQRPKRQVVRFDGGHVEVPSGPGLGFDVDREEIEALSQRRERRLE